VSARFAGSDGHRRLVGALADQTLLRGDPTLPPLFADCVEIVELADGDVLFSQDADDFDMAMVLSGTVNVLVNGRRVASRYARQHVGEMALIDPSARRSATVAAAGSCVVARVTEADLSRIAADHPDLWRHLACEHAGRLRERNALVLHRRQIPHMFVGSSSEHYAVAEAVTAALSSPSLEVVPWKEDVFRPSRYTLPDLEVEAHASDFAVLVLGEDDLVETRGDLHIVARDNVILELGLFVGSCGHERVFLLVPDADTVKLPSDLTGITTLRFTCGSAMSGPDVADAVGQIARVVAEKGAL
jgi:CRP/FNR family cyclic AMP-dependent transcriptional regulator